MKKNPADLFHVAAPLPPEQAAIRAWLKLNRATLEGRTADEVAHLAIMCGFSVDDVCATLSTFLDAMTGGRIEDRAALAAWSFERTCERVMKMRQTLEEETARKELAAKRIFIEQAWSALVAYQITGEEIGA